MSELPDGIVQCTWCGHGVRVPSSGRCPNCGLTIPGYSPAVTDEADTSGSAKKATKPRAAAVKGGKERRRAPRNTPLGTETTGQRILGVDPGARYTGVVIRDGDVVLYSSTFVRDKDASAHEWARTVISELRDLLEEWGDLPIGVEGVSDPKGFKGGERAALNPAHIMRAAVVFGAVAAVWPDAIVVPPGGNGSQHISHYPKELVGRRPKDLPGSNAGAGTRAHEQSAYDVAGKAAKVLWPPKPERLLGL